MKCGVAAQECRPNDALRLHGDRDVSGVWPQLSELADQTVKDGQSIDRLIANSEVWAGLPDLGTYGTVVSACLLSQLVDAVVKSLGEAHPRCLEVIEAVRQRHLRLLHELTAPRGTSILVTDFVSSDTALTLPTLAGKELSETLLHMIKHHNFFTGLNPFRLQMLLREDPMLASSVRSIHCESPWLWDFGPRHFAVTAIVFQRS